MKQNNNNSSRRKLGRLSRPSTALKEDPRIRRNAAATTGPLDLEASLALSQDGKLRVEAQGPITSAGKLGLNYDSKHLSEDDTGALTVNIDGITGDGLKGAKGQLQVAVSKFSPLEINSNGELGFAASEAVADPAGGSASQIRTSLEALLTALRDARIIST